MVKGKKNRGVFASVFFSIYCLLVGLTLAFALANLILKANAKAKATILRS